LDRVVDESDLGTGIDHPGFDTGHVFALGIVGDSETFGR
jgi:hypothetical protein